MSCATMALAWAPLVAHLLSVGTSHSTGADGHSTAAPVQEAPLPWFPGVHDAGIILPFGDSQCPGDCDKWGARDTFVWHDPTDAEFPFKMTYDGSGPLGWIASLAVSNDPTLRTWKKKGTVLKLGPPGSVDSNSASYLTTYLADDGKWYGYYLATNQTSPPPGDVPIGPYFSMLATAPTSDGPWTQHEDLGTIFDVGSPGVIMKNPNDPGEYWQFCTGCAGGSIGLVTTRDLGGKWTNRKPLVQGYAVENTALYYENANGLWFLFTNHIGPDQRDINFDDSIWVFWSSDLLNWPSNQKAVVLNQTNVIEPSFKVGRVGLPSILKVPGNDRQLALIYDGGGTEGDVSYNERCSVALAWLDLPLQPPQVGLLPQASIQI